MTSSHTLTVYLPMHSPDTWAVIAYFVLVATGIVFSLSQRHNSVRMFSAVANSLQGFNRWVVGWTGLSSKLVVGLEIGLFLTAGGLLLALEQYAIAIIVWIIISFVIVAKAVEWQGISNVLVSGLLRTAWILAGVGLCAFLMISTDLTRDGKPWFPKKCLIVIDVKSEIIAVVHAHAKWVPARHETEVYTPLFQDLFLEWTITVTPNKKMSKIALTIRDARQPTDKIRVVAQSATVSEPKPGWSSGFDEPTQIPDFYERTITLSDFDYPVTITLRHPVKFHFGTFTVSTQDLDLDRQLWASVDKCRIDTRWHSGNGSLGKDNLDFGRLAKELDVFLHQQLTNGQPVTRPDPDEPYPRVPVGESEMIEELHCVNEPCTTIGIYTNEKTRR